jgi:antitoxin component HigA of HigAB toxin-antitoxin module
MILDGDYLWPDRPENGVMTKISIIRDEAGYTEALAAFEAYFDNEPEVGSDDGDRFELLGLHLAKYEEERFA